VIVLKDEKCVEYKDLTNCLSIGTINGLICMAADVPKLWPVLRPAVMFLT